MTEAVEQVRQGAGCVSTARLDSPLGPLVAGATAEGICLLEFGDRPAADAQGAAERKQIAGALAVGGHEHLEQLGDELGRYFAGTLTEFRVPLVYPGSPFQEAVWRGLLRIPYGATWSYEALACAVGVPAAQRAVGRANGCNRLVIVIPCHRVINKDGRLGGYGGGPWRKQFLLDLERGGPRVSSQQSALSHQLPSAK